ncbi:hypothetical protein BCR42DRAFT_1349 [Absidia repens]|uniref:Uncharacterized protein n=1 Tax=Absidia repens TaxID=90262 RepID=A0A1X2IZT6_9FUNG|nr:hypothetical protein BCR42DRAFT_1349 [Absidia repens]
MTNSFLEQMANDIQEARRKATFPIVELSKVVSGGEAKFDTAKKLRAILNKEPLLADPKVPFMNREQVSLVENEYKN